MEVVASSQPAPSASRAAADDQLEGGLQSENPHPRDADIQFFEEGHIYDVKGDRTYTSSTSVVHRFFGEFDADDVIKRMRRGRNWSTSKYVGMTDDEIKELWKANAVDASERGTLLHGCIERFYNKWPLPEALPDEYDRLFMPFHAQTVRRGLVPYRSEWCVYDEDHRVSGSIDMLYQVGDDPNKLMIYDWKRSKELKMTPYGDATGKAPLDALPDCNFWHYCMQLNLYRDILQRKYGKTIVGMFLVVLHPNQKAAIEKEVPVLEEETQAMLRAHCSSHSAAAAAAAK